MAREENIITNIIINNKIAELLSQDGLRFAEVQFRQLAAFCEAVRGANEAASLVSTGDSARLESIHIPDSLSLAPWVERLAGTGGQVLDIGSGGGFPAIPIKIALPSLQVTLVERSEKKSAFLRGLVAELGLHDTKVITGEFPFAAQGLNPKVITARAVERPEKLRRQVLRYLPKGCAFLCQMPQSLGEFPSEFHVEHIVDMWTDEGIRRGTLDIVRRG